MEPRRKLTIAHAINRIRKGPRELSKRVFEGFCDDVDKAVPASKREFADWRILVDFFIKNTRGHFTVQSIANKDKLVLMDLYNVTRGLRPPGPIPENIAQFIYNLADSPRFRKVNTCNEETDWGAIREAVRERFHALYSNQMIKNACKRRKYIAPPSQPPPDDECLLTSNEEKFLAEWLARNTAADVWL